MFKGWSQINTVDGAINLTEIYDVHDGVERSQRHNHPSRKLVQVNVLVERENRAQASRSQICQRLTQHQNQHKRAIEVQTLS